MGNSLQICQLRRFRILNDESTVLYGLYLEFLELLLVSMLLLGYHCFRDSIKCTKMLLRHNVMW